MKQTILKRVGVIALGALIVTSTQAMAQTAANSATTDTHTHTHKDEGPSLVDAAAVQARSLSDWVGDWQSLYPLLQDGTLGAVMDHKAENGEKTAEEYRAYYELGYKTDVERILIDGSSVRWPPCEK